MREIKQKHPNLALDALILAAGAALAILSGHFGARPGHPLVQGPGAVLGGIYIMYIGSLFLLSYFFPDSTYIVNFLRYVCVECSRGGQGRHMALLYFALAVGFGGWLLLFGLGVSGCAPSSAFPVRVQDIRQIDPTNTTRISFEETGGHLFVTLSDKHGDGHIHIVNYDGSSKQQVLELLKQKQTLLEARQ